MDLIEEVCRLDRALKRPMIWMGDWNIQRSHVLYKRFRKMGLVDAFVHLDLPHTTTSLKGDRTRGGIDYIFCTPDIADRLESVEIVARGSAALDPNDPQSIAASDHLPRPGRIPVLSPHEGDHMKLIVGGHHLWRDAALIADILEKCQNSTEEKLRIVPALGHCGTLTRQVANRVGYTIIEPPMLAKGASLDTYNAALVKAHTDAAFMIVFHDDFFTGEGRNRRPRKNLRTRNLTDKAVAVDMGIILVSHQFGTMELN